MGSLWYYEHVVAGRIAYVGITNSATGRGVEHMATKPYFGGPVAILVTPFAEGTTRAEARAYESEQILRIRPPFNNKGNPDYPQQAADRADLCMASPTVVGRLDRFRLRAERAARSVVTAGVGVIAGAGVALVWGLPGF